jgi:hypothetical protein
VILGIIKAAEENLYSLYLFGFSNGARGTCNGQQKPDTFFGESLLLRKLILGIQAQVRGKSLTGLIVVNLPQILLCSQHHRRISIVC